eukprot:9335711-Pyramimonas_sp.AAC.1
MGPDPSMITKPTGSTQMNPTPTVLSFTSTPLPPRQDVQKVIKEEGHDGEEGTDIRLTIGGNLTAQRQQMSMGGSLRDHCAALFHRNCGTTNTVVNYCWHSELGQAEEFWVPGR